jgi:hypothetical protein
MLRTIASLLIVCVATAVVTLPAAADEEVLFGGRSIDPYRTHPLSPGPEYDHDSADPCRQLAAARWGADYVAGVDAYGRRVAPADLDHGRYSDSGPVVSFDVLVPRRPGAARRDDMIAGTVTIDTATGLVALDGRPLAPSDLAYLQEACAGR